ncbi:MAG: hypothetical protein JO244_10770 [Solirubrobacterales bacterium]|nr:hypothetical protein [Solirubrobacterales bacterium]
MGIPLRPILWLELTPYRRGDEDGVLVTLQEETPSGVVEYVKAELPEGIISQEAFDLVMRLVESVAYTMLTAHLNLAPRAAEGEAEPFDTTYEAFWAAWRSGGASGIRIGQHARREPVRHLPPPGPTGPTLFDPTP